MADSGKGWGRKILGALVELEDEQSSATPQPQTQAPPTMTSTGFTPAPATSLPAGPVVDPAIMQHLQTKVMSRRTAFTSLLEAAEKLKSYIPDDVTRLKAAATTNGGDKNAILQAIDVHVNDLDAEAANFRRFSDGEATTKVQALINEADRLDGIATHSDGRVQQLQQEIASLQAQASESRAKAAEARGKAAAEQAELQRKSEAFTLALNTAKAGLTQQKTMLASAL